MEQVLTMPGIRKENKVYRILFKGEAPVGEELVRMEDLEVGDIFHMYYPDGVPVEQGKCWLVHSQPFFTDNAWNIHVREWSKVGPDLYVDAFGSTKGPIRAWRGLGLFLRLWYWLKSFPLFVDLHAWRSMRRMLGVVSKLRFDTIDRQIRAKDPNVRLRFPHYRTKTTKGS